MTHSIASPLAPRRQLLPSLQKVDNARNDVQSDQHGNVTLVDIYRKLVDLLSEVASQKASKKAIRLPDVKELTGDSRSQIYARMNPKYAAYDKTWPKPFYIGKSVRWWEHDITAWLEAHAASSAATYH